MFGTIFSQVGIAVLVGTFAFAWWKGDLAERIGGSINLAAGVFAFAIHPLLSKDVQPVALLVVDAALAMGFLFLAIRYTSLWLGVAMLLQAVQFSLHAYYLVTEAAHDWNYARINNIDTTGINLMIIIGTVIAWRRRMRLRLEEAAKAETVPATPPAS
ncbi:MAG TPA: hypothetical protein VFE03_17055 [Caulobacteraceae bacterium]|jgi:hypothetical protein|nr:hypothetical protein [Caulobacteraceae bacterium]